MMSSLPPLTLGPLMLPPGLWLSLLMLAVATVIWRKQLAKVLPQSASDDTPLAFAGLGMLGARIGFVGLYWREYLESPWAVINIRDGGWWWPAGVAAIALGAALLGWRRPPLRRPLLLASTAAAAIGVLAVIVAGTLSNAAEERLPALQVHSLTGEPLPLHDGRPAVINLWASWCPPCRREMPVLVEGARRYPTIRFLLVNQGEDLITVEAAGRQWPIPAPLLALDMQSLVSTTLGVRGYPTTFFVSADGRILGRHTGEVSSASLAALIESINTDARIIAEDQP
jgi:thiol-disulfide isomerase/thioredoxin